MDRSAVFVDASYLFAEGSFLLTGERQRRETISLDIPKVVAALKRAARTASGLELLRIYWYDAAPYGRPSFEQLKLADVDDVKLRLGQINSANEQKGVDAMIVTDLAELARNRAITDAVLVSGDEDLRVGVMLAQQFGVRVHLVGIQPRHSNQSRSLAQEADTTDEWDAEIVRRFLSHTPAEPMVFGGSTGIDSELEEAIRAFVAKLSLDERGDLKTWFGSNRGVPPDYDRELLRIGRIHYNQYELSNPERSLLRAMLVRVIQSQP